MPVPVNSLNRGFIQMRYSMAHKKSSAWAYINQCIFINDASASLSLRPSQTPASLRDLGKKKH